VSQIKCLKHDEEGRKRMVCKLCGRAGFMIEKAESEFEKHEREAYEKLKDKSCDELLEIRGVGFYSTRMNMITAFDVFAAEKILLERGH